MGTRARVAGTVLVITAALVFLGGFITAARTPLSNPKLPPKCEHQACDAAASASNRQTVFYSWMGVALLVLVGGIVLRSTGNRSANG
jgi:hypothetical protein